MMLKIKFLTLILTLMITAARAEEGWIPYYFPVIASMAPDYQGQSAETFNARELLDAPAGVHGFCVVVGSHFYFTDGKRARFWGTNIVGKGCFPDKTLAEILADRIAYFGFNAVRLTGIDKASDEELARLDYLVYQLKQRGIYININLGLDIMAIFDPLVLERSKSWALSLLSHLNPYTKLRYNQDPAVCMIEINNGMSLAALDLADLPEKYHKTYFALQEAWLDEDDRRWLYENGYSLVADIRDWQAQKHSNASMMKTLGEDETTLYVERITDKAWHLQFSAGGLRLRKGQDYILEFSAKADRKMKISVEVQQHAPPWKNLGLDHAVELGVEYAEYSVTFKASDSVSNAKVGFILGYQTGIVNLKDVSLHEDLSGTKAADFNKYIEIKYLKETRDFLHDELNIKVPVGVGAHPDPRQMAVQRQALDHVDTKVYWEKPESIFSVKNGVLSVFSEKEPGKRPLPRVVSEWSHSYPNEFAYETPLMLAQEARENDWDALFQYSFTRGGGDEKIFDMITGPYDINSNAQQLMLDSFAARIFLADVEPKKNPVRAGITRRNAVIKFNKATLRIGRIKNTDSGYNPDGTYNWGKAPTLLEP